jgi:hypothetical protein
MPNRPRLVPVRLKLPAIRLRSHPKRCAPSILRHDPRCAAVRVARKAADEACSDKLTIERAGLALPC